MLFSDAAYAVGIFLVGVTVAAVCFGLGWRAGRMCEREMADMLHRQRRRLNPYVTVAPPVDVERTK